MPPPASRHLDIEIAAIADEQHGVITRKQLVLLASEGAIRHRLTVRRLSRLHAGVYAVGPGRASREGRYLAAVLACGNGAVLSHRSAAALWGLRPTPSGPVDVTVTRGTRRRPGIAIHTTRGLRPEEFAERDGILCTSPARTLLDLASVLTPNALDRALEQALILSLYDQRALDDVLHRARGRKGAQLLRCRLAKIADDPAPLRSELERRFFEIIKQAGLPVPAVNAAVAGYEVDFNWYEARLIVETDGRSTHATPQAFERDRRRDLDLECAGWHVIRLTWRQVTAQPRHVTEMLRRRLAGSAGNRPEYRG